jgi:hypothetical protein
MQSDLFEEHKPTPPEDPNKYLYDQLIKLGDMLGDGLGHEPGEEWIAQDYRRVCKALGLTRPRRNNGAAINVAVSKYLETNRCECGGLLKQTRSGAMRVFCTSCCRNYRLKTAKKPRPTAGA